jgi:hypothetical protein
LHVRGMRKLCRTFNEFSWLLFELAAEVFALAFCIVFPTFLRSNDQNGFAVSYFPCPGYDFSIQSL